MTEKSRKALMTVLEERFEDNPDRHAGIEWAEARSRLEADPGKLESLKRMEDSGGEPDVIGRDAATGEFIFCDCAPESPSGRRNLCYDRAALDSRKEHRPEGSAVETAMAMGIELLSEEQYRALQGLGPFDLKTSSWIRTPEKIRKLGGALFADRRYDAVFVYHNGAESYYGARGFRGALRV